MATIDGLMIQEGANVYYTDGFRNILEDHMTYLRTHPTTRTLDVTPKQAEKYEYDLIGLLNELEIPMYLHWVVARANSFNSVNEVPSDLVSLLIPDHKEVAKLQQTYQISSKIS
jgi:hypothetical protein